MKLNLSVSEGCMPELDLLVNSWQTLSYARGPLASVLPCPYLQN